MINRLVPTLLVDFRQQVRYGFIVASLFTMIVFIAMLSQFSQYGSPVFVPLFVFGNLMIGTFFFIGGMVLFEKGEGVLQALIVSPLRVEEYLGSKVLTLTALAFIENMAIVLAIFGTGYNVLLLAAGTILAAVIYVLLGFVMVSRFKSISEYLMPAAFVIVALMLPLVDYLQIFETPLVYLHPMQAPLLVMKAAFVPVESWQLAYGVLYSLIVIAVAFVLSKRAFDRHIINRKGGN
ncbi:fluoroquinolone export ABC transporter permease subunit [Methanocella arvoryzae]|uniref:ABC-type transport system, permease component n=1 Tax=Methanocella arvoryzae (strain DSM 22066 / NBRC 105507 / MRE50) TaxID=351160 RepID=Q0W5F1_METAR|nr:ABC transporter permease [Methanocella arvoryzae]CAJ36392.1 conserved hypothetical protein [Methanocella arvoryzae MRE50]